MPKTTSTEVVQPTSLVEMIREKLVAIDERDPAEITASIIAQNMAAETVDDLFRELTSAKDDFVNVPFICEGIEFRESTVGDSPFYAIITARDTADAGHLVSCSAPDVYSKLLKLEQLGQWETTPVVIREKTTGQGFTVLKLERVSMEAFKAGDVF